MPIAPALVCAFLLTLCGLTIVLASSREAVEAGHMLAAYYCGHCYEHGLGVRRDFNKAAELYTVAAVGGVGAAAFAISNLARTVAAVLPRLHGVFGAKSPYSIEAPPEHAAFDTTVPDDLTQLVVELGVCAVPTLACVFASSILLNYRAGDPNGHCYLASLEKDPLVCVRYYTLAADKGLSTAQCNLGVLYDRGIGTTVCVCVCVCRASKPCEHVLCSCFFEAGVERNEAEALKWFQRAAAQQNPVAEYNLGSYYENGIGTPLNLDKAVKLYAASAEKVHLARPGLRFLAPSRTHSHLLHRAVHRAPSLSAFATNVALGWTRHPSLA